MFAWLRDFVDSVFNTGMTDKEAKEEAKNQWQKLNDIAHHKKEIVVPVSKETQKAIDEMVVHNFGYGDPGTVSWKCPHCEEMASMPFVEENQDLVCNICHLAKPMSPCDLEEDLAQIPARDRTRILIQIKKALLWKGWDKECGCHACDSIRKIDELFARNAKHYGEYT